MIRDVKWVLGDGRALNGMIALSVIAALLQGATFVLLVPLLRALILGDLPDAWRWAWTLTGVALGFAVTLWFSAMLGQRVAIGLTEGLYQRLGDKIARLPLGAVDLDLTGRLARLTSKGVMQVATVPAHLIRPVITAVGTPVTVVIGMTLIDLRIGLTALIALPFLAGTYLLAARIVGRRDKTYAAATAQAAGRIVEFARVQPALRAFRGSHSGDDALARALDSQHQTYRSLLVGGAAGMSVFAVALQAVVTVMVLLGTALALGGSLDLPALVALLVLSLRFVEPLMQVADLGSAMRVSGNSLAEMREILDAPELPEPAVPARPADASIELRDVGFAYRPGTEVLSGISFTVAPGTTTALVGPSGSGKSTLIKLVARFYDATAGSVRIGGCDVRDLGTAATMEQVSLVFQDVYLFSGTLLENIRMGRPEASDEEVFAAARAAEVDEIAARLGDGWESQVGEGGGMLSGGERQRVSIARAILKDAPILLLDEATSALDPANELAVSRALHHLEGRSRLMIAHRLDTVVNADQIVVLSADGRIAEIGDHATLLAADGPYAAFWRARTEAAGWSLATV